MGSRAEPFIWIAGGAAVLLLLGSGTAGAAAPSRPRTTPQKPTTSPAAADALATKMAADIKARQYDYSRQLCKDFQSAVGIPSDGIYGPQTAEALRVYVDPPPKFLFKRAAGASAPTVEDVEVADPREQLLVSAPSSATAAREDAGIAMIRAREAARKAAGTAGPAPMPAAVTSAPAPINLEVARREAKPLSNHITKKGKNYSRQLLKDFQGHAGLTVDGYYGPKSVSALRYFGVANPPAALFAGSTDAYSPETE